MKKYTEKCQNFQRTGCVWQSIVCTMLFSVVGGAQEIVWPVPSSAPEYLAGIQTNVESYDEYFPPLQAVTLYAGRRTSSGLFYGKMSSGWRSGHQGGQAEVEWYPLLGRTGYAYVGYAYGSSAPFPRHRGGIEYFRSLPDAFEASGGVRLFQFQDRKTIVLATGTLNRYVGNFWISARPYFSLNLRHVSASANLTGRYYPGTPEEFWFIRIGAGFTPDERSTLTTGGMTGSELFTLHSQSVALGGQRWLTKRLLGIIDAGLTRQEVGFRLGTYVLNASLWCGVRVTL